MKHLMFLNGFRQMKHNMINFDCNLDYVLENEAVMLRPLQSTDTKNLLSISESEPELWQYSLLSAAGEINLEKYINLALNARDNKREYAFIVFDKRKQLYAGSTRFYDIQMENKSTQLGYTWIGKEFQGNYLNKGMKYLMLEFAFDVCGFNRVEFRADNRNEKSKAAMLSIGCTIEGVLRQNSLKHDGTLRDSVILSILKNEWDEGKKIKLYQKLHHHLVI